MLRNTLPLEKLQADFAAFIQGDDDAMAGRVRATRKASVNVLLGVYRDAYALRLVEALETHYGVLKRVLGDDDFDRLGRAYVARHPSRHFSIRWFGDRLPAFLAAEAPWRDTPAYAELARLEWALAAAFDAPDAPSFDPGTLAAVAPEEWGAIGFDLHPSLQALDFAWTVPELWNALAAEADEVPPPERRESPVPFAVWRLGLETYFRSMTADEAWALAAARAGGSFGAICEGLCQFVPEAEAGDRAAALLREWIGQGWVTGAAVRA